MITQSQLQEKHQPQNSKREPWKKRRLSLITFFLGSSSSTASIMLKTKATFLLQSMIVDLNMAADFVSILHPLGALWSVSPRLLKLDSRPQNRVLPIAEKMVTGQCSVILPPPKYVICSHTGHGEQCPVGVQCKCPVVLPGRNINSTWEIRL